MSSQYLRISTRRLKFLFPLARLQYSASNWILFLKVYLKSKNAEFVELSKSNVTEISRNLDSRSIISQQHACNQLLTPLIVQFEKVLLSLRVSQFQSILVITWSLFSEMTSSVHHTETGTVSF